MVWTTHATVCCSGSQLNNWTLVSVLVSQVTADYGLSWPAFIMWLNDVMKQISGKTLIIDFFLVTEADQTVTFNYIKIKYRYLGQMTLPTEPPKSWFDCRDVGRCLNQLSLTTMAMSPARGDWTACCRWVKVIICWCSHSNGRESKQILAQHSGICHHMADISL